MNQIIQTEIIQFGIPKHYLPKIMFIMTSGVLDLKGDKGILHFDHDGHLRLVEYSKKILPPN